MAINNALKTGMLLLMTLTGASLTANAQEKTNTQQAPKDSLSIAKRLLEIEAESLLLPISPSLANPSGHFRNTEIIKPNKKTSTDSLSNDCPQSGEVFRAILKKERKIIFPEKRHESHVAPAEKYVF